MKPSEREISNSLPFIKFISLLERPYFCGQCRLIHDILAFYEDKIWTLLPALFMTIYTNTQGGVGAMVCKQEHQQIFSKA